MSTAAEQFTAACGYTMPLGKHKGSTLARFEVEHHAHTHAAELTRRTGRTHFVYRIPQRDTTRPRAQGVLVGAAIA